MLNYSVAELRFSTFSTRVSKFLKDNTPKLSALFFVFLLTFTANAQKFIEGTYIVLHPGGIYDPVSFTFNKGKIKCDIWHGSTIITGTYQEQYPGVFRVNFKDVVKGSVNGLYNYSTRYNVEWSEEDDGRRYVTFSNVSGLQPLFALLGRFYLTGPNAYNKAKKAAYDKKLRHEEELKESENQLRIAREEEEQLRVEGIYLEARSYYDINQDYKKALSTIKQITSNRYAGEDVIVLAAECACRLYMKRRDAQYLDDVITFCERAEKNYKKRINPYCLYLAYLAKGSNKFSQYENEYLEAAKERVNDIKSFGLWSFRVREEIIEIAWNIACYMKHTKDKKATALYTINTAIGHYPDDLELQYKKCEILLQYNDVTETRNMLTLIKERFSTQFENGTPSNSNISEKLVETAASIAKTNNYSKESEPEALFAIDTAIDFFPNDPRLLYWKCELLLNYKDIDAAKKTWKQFKKKFKTQFKEGNYAESSVAKRLSGYSNNSQAKNVGIGILSGILR